MRHRTIAPLFVLAAVLVWGASKGGDAEKGKALFGQQCVTCHNAANTEKKLGPGLKGLFKMDKLANGKKATEQNIRAQIDNGGNGMPPYKDMLGDHEKDDLVAYLKTL
ncbi:MAG: cytochrome c [Bryobacteraceae bacterium]|jgi:mono/diheme cytochrome c family protein